MSKNIILGLIFSIVTYFFSLASTAQAAIIRPDFPNCTNPQGTLKVSYQTGTHGIAGNTGSFQGSDTVYTISSDTTMQCFCAVDGSGVQTNWWRVTSLTQDEIDLLKAEGWIYIPNGSLWGLDNTPYLAKNTNFSCKSSGSTSNNSNSSSNNQVAGASFTASAGNVLGLASTGNLKSILAFLAGGLFALALGSALTQPKKNVK